MKTYRVIGKNLDILIDAYDVTHVAEVLAMTYSQETVESVNLIILIN